MATDLEQTNKALEAEANALLDKLVSGDKKTPEPKEAEAEETSEPEAKASDNEVTEETTEESETKDARPFKVFKTEEDYTREIERKGQGRADQLLESYNEKIKSYKKQVSDLTAKLNEKDFMKVFEADAEDIGEDKAKARKEVLQRIAAEHKDYQEGKATLEDTKQEYEQKFKVLSVAEKTQFARDLALKHLLPDGEPFISRSKDFIKELMEGNLSRREMELIAEKRGNEIQAKQSSKPKARPDSGKVTTAGKAGKFTRSGLAGYDTKGKSVKDMMSDAEALLDQMTRK